MKLDVTLNGIDKDRISKKILAKARTRVIASMKFTLNTIMPLTPVWTGRTISNYLWSVNGIRQTVIQAGVYGDWEEIKSSEDGEENREEAEANARGSLVAAIAMVRQADWPLKVYLFNPTKYHVPVDDEEEGIGGMFLGIEALEYGHIGTAPGGYRMFTKTAAALQSAGMASIDMRV